MSTTIAPPSLPALLRARALTCAYQPIVDLATGTVVAYEALVRGPAGSELARPDQLFAAAEDEGLVVELDWACRAAAVEGALRAGLDRTTGLFVNVEPRALRAPVPEALIGLLDLARDRLRIVVEVTERALVDDPAAMVTALQSVRAAGFGVALDDVGADPASLALLPFVEPDVIKLDLRLVHERTDAEIAAIAAAVRADSERRGAAILAEGIETTLHRHRAEVLGATYGQGWLFGRPGPLGASAGAAAAAAALPVAPGASTVPDTPWSLVRSSPLRRTTSKSLLMPMSRHLEQQGRAGDAHAVVLGAFQDAMHFTPATAARYAALADTCALVGAIGRSLDRAPAAVRTGALASTDPLTREWTVTVVAPHYAGALIAREHDDNAGPDAERRFDYVITHDRATVVAAARSLLQRLTPR